MANVKISKIGSRVIEVAVADQASGYDALRLAGVTLAANEQVLLDGDPFDLSDNVTDGDVLSIVQKTGIKGGRR